MCKWVTHLLVALTVGFFGPPLASGQTAPMPEQLVRELSSPSFAVRKQATDRLLALGLAAVPALEAGKKGADLETIRRCDVILVKARRTDREILIDDFALDSEGKKNITLTGWERFRKLAGDDPAARQAFVDLLKTEGEIWELLETDKKAAGAKFTERYNAYLQRLRLVVQGRHAIFSYPESMGALLLATDKRLTPTGEELQTVLNIQSMGQAGEWYSPTSAKIMKGLIDETSNPQVAVSLMVFGQSRNLAGFDDDALKPAILRLVPIFQAAPEQRGSQFVLRVGAKLKLKEVVPLAKAILKNKKVNQFDHLSAIQVMAELGGTDAIAVIEESFADRREICGFKVNPDDKWIWHQASDSALVALLDLTKQSPADYGFPFAKFNPEQPITSRTGGAGFYDDRGRNAAIQQLRDWSAKNLGKKSVP